MTDDIELTRTSARAVNLVILYELDLLGRLEGLTLQNIADLLFMGHRSTAMRTMRALDQVKAELPEARERFTTGRPRRKSITTFCPTCGRGYKRPSRTV